MQYLDFEKSVQDIEGAIQELRAKARNEPSLDISEEVETLQLKAQEHLKELYERLTPWQKCQIARHPDRPQMMDYVGGLFDEFTPLAGDRAFGEDRAVVGGPARLRGKPVMLIGQEKGRDTQSRLHRNFGMARPEGYRKAVRLMDLANRFGMPIIAFVDTPGAYPGKGAEERGQAEAIARSTDKCLTLDVPSVAIVSGEGGSGGAVALATANRVLMLEHSVYSVISPEGCASILWKSAERARDAATALRLTSQDLLALGVVDRVTPEPLGGAHRAPKETIARVGDALWDLVSEVAAIPTDEVREDRRLKFLQMGDRRLA